jgi:thiamine-monophosphate kinase
VTDHTTREHRLIAKIKQWTDERLIGDDCALLPGQTLVTADTLVEHTHFVIPGISYADLGWKSIAVNLSDIAAMCGRPRFAIVNLTLPPQVREADIEHLYLGMVDCARAYRCRIVGGDLTRGDIIVISITVLGEAHERGVALRNGAKPGDVVVCTGDFGASAAGLWTMQHGEAPHYKHVSQKHFRPLPRLCESWSLVRATGGRCALMDASDGLADALVQIAAASKVGMDIDASNLPVHAETRDVAKRAGVDVMDWILYGGEDYELVGTIAPEHWSQLQESPHNAFVKIGTVTNEAQNVSLRRAGQTLPVLLEKTYQHWSEE